MSTTVKRIENHPGEVFDINHTYLIKGIAILFMVLHHLVGYYYNSFDLNWYGQFSGNKITLIIVFFSTAGKVCVPLLTIVSGFGLSRSYEKYKANQKNKFYDVRFVLSHLIQFYSVYWVMFFINFVTKLLVPTEFINFYGHGIDALKNCFVDFWGLSKLIYGKGGFGDWFVGAILIMYIVFPMIYRIGNKLRFLPLAICAVPWIFKPFFNSVGIKTDSAVFCLLAFSTGVLFAQTNFFEKLKNYLSFGYKLISVLIVLIAFALRLVFSMYMDYFFALALINFGVFVLFDVRIIKKVLVLFGKNSANIWLCHGMIILFFAAISSKITDLPIWVKYPAVLLTALLLSMLVEFLKEKTKYLKLVKKMRCIIEN